MAVEFQQDEPDLIKKAEEIFRSGIPYSNGNEFLRIVPEFADVILVISDSYFPSYNTRSEPVNTKNNHEVLSCKCGVLGRHIIFFCQITTADNEQHTIRLFNIIICPDSTTEFYKITARHCNATTKASTACIDGKTFL